MYMTIILLLLSVVVHHFITFSEAIILSLETSNINFYGKWSTFIKILVKKKKKN